MSNPTALSDKEKLTEVLSLLVENTELGVWYGDLIEQTVWWSPNFYKMLGYENNEIEASNEIFEKLIHPDDVGRTYERYAESIEKVKTFKIDYRLKTKEGNYKWFKAIGNFTKDDNGNASRMVGTWEDITEEKTTQLELEQTKELTKAGNFTAYFDEPNAIWTKELDEILDIEQDDNVVRGKELFYSLVHPDDTERFMQERNEALKNGFGKIKFRFISVKKNIKHVVIHIKPILNSEKKPIGIRGSVVDITETVRAQEELHKYKKLFTLSIDMVCIADVDGYFKEVNPAFMKVLGYTEEKILSTPFIDFIHPDDIDATLKEVEKLAKGIPTIHFVNRYRKKDDSYLWLDWLSTPDKNTGELFSVARDITQLKEQEDMLLQSSQSLNEAQQTANIGSWGLDLLTGKPTWSDQTFHIHELPVGEVPPVEEGINFYDDDSKEIITKAVQKAINDGIPYDLKLGINTAKGNHKWVRAIGKADFENGKAVRLSGVFQDITHEKKFEDALRKAKEEAESASKAKSDFLSAMSHEIRTPMNAVIGMTHLLLQEDPLPNQIENLNALKFSADNLLSLINDILDYSKIEAGKIELEKNDFNLKELVKGIKHSLQYRANEKGVDLKLKMDSDIPDIITGDPTRVSQIVTNIVGNAIKFTDKGNVTIDLSLEEEKDDLASIKFSVKDTGIGIPEDKMNTIFKSFEQSNSDITRKFGGSGLGLAITKKLLEIHDSDIIVKSEVEVGSEFSFTLDLRIVKKQHVNSRSTNSTNKYESLKGMKVLLVEDNNINILLASKFLDKWDVDVDVAEEWTNSNRKS